MRSPTEQPADAPAKSATLWTRRDWCTRSAWAMVVATLAIIFGAMGRLLFPRVRFAPPSTVVLGRPEAFAVKGLYDKWKKSHSVILGRDREGFFALRAVCTHLGCIPNWQPSEKKLKCPCHGSGFHENGENFEGPAPRALDRLKIFVDAEGQLVVDTAVRFRYERGEWEHAEAFVRLPTESAGVEQRRG